MAETAAQQSIRERFYEMELPNQVVVYAEALIQEKFELLHVLKHLIRPKHKTVFHRMVKDYIVGKYGKNYY